jgi:hypothetical protein
MQDHESASCVIKGLTSEIPGAANANTGNPSGEQDGKSESAVMATSPKEDPNSQSTVRPASTTEGGTTPLIPQAVKVMSIFLISSPPKAPVSLKTTPEPPRAIRREAVNQP